jgi:hypothetical protein
VYGRSESLAAELSPLGGTIGAMADTITCSGCGLDLTDDGARGTCPRCGETARVFTVSVSPSASSNITLSGQRVMHRTLEVTPELPPATIIAEPTKELAAHHDLLTAAYPPTDGGDMWVVVLSNEADGTVLEIVVANDPSYVAEAIRRAIEDELS